MPRPSLANAAQLKDPFQTYNFSLTFPSIPGGGQGQERELVYKCQTAALPGFALEVVEVPYHTIMLRYAGRMTYTGTFTATFLEVRDISTRKAFRRWMQFARNHDTNSGAYKEQYSIAALLELYDDLPATVHAVGIMNCWPSEVTELALETSSATAGQLSVTFTYDYTLEVA